MPFFFLSRGKSMLIKIKDSIIESSKSEKLLNVAIYIICHLIIIFDNHLIMISYIFDLLHKTSDVLSRATSYMTFDKNAFGYI